MLKIILVALILLVVTLLLYAATQPDTFRFQRSTTINAPADKVFPFINDFKRWTAWSPYEKMDSDLKRTYSGASQGQGSMYEWDGKNTGQGRMEILRSSPSSNVTIKLDFIKPFEGHNTAEFTLDSQGSSTTVTWSMYGPQPFLQKLMSVFGMMERMLGPQFEAGLANLKAIAEK